ncbi:MAG: hypothetical protein K0S29_856 [Gammaproteobacteria bacterium]|nr:hypothetical protein [Gammaproteobacteria bacterium]
MPINSPKSKGETAEAALPLASLALDLSLIKNYFSQSPILTDLIAGAAAGIGAGTVVSPAETFKIRLQAGLSVKPSLALFSEISKSIPPFSGIFGLVCAAEFTVNDKIHQQYGRIPALVSSAISGALCLTAADHLIFRSHKDGISFTQALQNFSVQPSKLWAGLSSMMTRELIFLINVLYLGPQLGRLLQTHLKHTKKESDAWDASGRYLGGLVTTWVSQPFDTLAREMQKAVKTNPKAKPSYATVFKNTSVTELWKGAVPRMFVAPIGGALIGFIYKHSKAALTGSYESHSNLVN